MKYDVVLFYIHQIKVFHIISMLGEIELNIPINPRTFYGSVCDFAISVRGEAFQYYRENNVVEII